ncbi:MAG TPA: SIR2 family protein [Candidatus Deferrimicrobium sp.]|nr:SIR2 family protein [Candidatus Kapabacteria bacterium]HLP59265.1 SIR2 family protein [Candidatus Deferrimicrobium sp.]
MDANEKNFERFYNHFTEEMDKEVAAVFIGAGLSIPGGYKTWKKLLSPIAVELGLDIDKEEDLISLAQYKVNSDRNRDSVTRLLVEEFANEASVTENHRLLASLPIHTLWTTNYDTLIEEAYCKAHKRLDVKIKTENLSYSKPGRDAVLYKMHGDKNDPHGVVLTKEDYETFNLNRGFFTEIFKGDLISKTFLFLGFSFTDPNINYILSRIRPLLGQNVKTHYCLMRRPQENDHKGSDKAIYEYECRKMQLRIEDLKRYGIQTLIIDDFSEVTDIFVELNKRICAKNIFVSGSTYDFAPWGRERIENLARLIGREIIRNGHNLTSGFGLGIGGAVIVGAMEQIYLDIESKISGRISFRPFPQTLPQGMSLAEMWTRYRKEMIDNVGFTIFLCGNKWDENTQQVVPANGVREEFEISKALGKYPVPIGASGSVAAEIWAEVSAAPERFYKNIDVKQELQVLGDPSKSNEDFGAAIFSIIGKVTGK